MVPLPVAVLDYAGYNAPAADTRGKRHAAASASGTDLVYRPSWPDARPFHDHETAPRLRVRVPAGLRDRFAPVRRGNLASAASPPAPLVSSFSRYAALRPTPGRHTDLILVDDTDGLMRTIGLDRRSHKKRIAKESTTLLPHPDFCFGRTCAQMTCGRASRNVAPNRPCRSRAIGLSLHGRTIMSTFLEPFGAAY